MSKNTLLTNQVIGGQSVILKIFRDNLEEADENIDKLEVTFFALTVFTYALLHFSTIPDADKKSDEVAIFVLENSLPHSGQKINFNESVRKYQKRYPEYKKLIDTLFEKKDIKPDEPNPIVTLGIHLYESVILEPRLKEQILKIVTLSPVLSQYILDNIDFIKQKVG